MSTFEKILSEYSRILVKETEVEIIQQKVIRINKNTAKSILDTEEKKLLEYSERIDQIRSEYSTYKINSIGIFTQILIFSFLKDTVRMKKIIEDSIKRIKQYPNKYSEVFSNICYGEGLSLYTKLGEFKKAEGLYEQRISYFKEGTMNWFRFKNLYLILNIHSKNYSKAFSLSNEIIHHPNFFKANTKTLRQRLFITRAFIEILVKAGKIRGVSSSMSSFKIPQFLKEVPTYRYDTGGFGFSVNIAEFIHNLIDKNYGKLIDKRESL